MKSQTIAECVNEKYSNCNIQMHNLVSITISSTMREVELENWQLMRFRKDEWGES